MKWFVLNCLKKEKLKRKSQNSSYVNALITYQKNWLFNKKDKIQLILEMEDWF